MKRDLEEFPPSSPNQDTCFIQPKTTPFSLQTLGVFSPMGTTNSSPGWGHGWGVNITSLCRKKAEKLILNKKWSSNIFVSVKLALTSVEKRPSFSINPSKINSIIPESYKAISYEINRISYTMYCLPLLPRLLECLGVACYIYTIRFFWLWTTPMFHFSISRVIAKESAYSS